MHYHIIIYENDNQYKKLTYRNYRTVIQKYNKLLNKANKVTFPKRFKKTKNNIERVNYTIKILNKNNIVLKQDHYNIEEKFKLLKSKKRHSFNEIKEYLKNNDKYYFLIIYDKNKVIFSSINAPIVFICKTEIDAEKLYLLIKDFCRKEKIYNCVFTGKLTKKNKKRFYKKLKEYYNIEEFYKKRSSFY